MDANQVVEDMQIATGWQNISLVNDTIVLKLNLDEMKLIKGLKQSNDCLYLDYDDFMDYPISFLVTTGNTAFQYWTLRRRLHRINDLPAYVSYDPDQDRIIRRWYWNGLKHRITGPAQEMTTGFKVSDLAGFSNFYQETWDSITLEWYKEGFPSSFPFCAKATMTGGQRIKNKTTNCIQSPRDDLAALTAETCEMNWDVFKLSNEFRPVSASITDLHEIYDKEGSITRRDCLECEFTWKRGTEVFKAEDHPEFNELFKDDLISLVDLWGPFYKDDSTEFVVITEFDRVKPK
jgi:hypothetical protein